MRLGIGQVARAQERRSNCCLRVTLVESHQGHTRKTQGGVCFHRQIDRPKKSSRLTSKLVWWLSVTARRPARELGRPGRRAPLKAIAIQGTWCAFQRMTLCVLSV